MKLSAKNGIWVVLFLSHLAFSADTLPECLDHQVPVPINNDQVVAWKDSTANQFRARGHVTGPIMEIYPNATGHQHFEVKLGNQPEDTLEVIYNTSFGNLPILKIGMTVEACGDYITSTAQSGPYPASPVGAIIHWIHRSPNLKKHESGFLAIDGVLYGQDAEHAGPKQPRVPAPAPDPGPNDHPLQ